MKTMNKKRIFSILLCLCLLWWSVCRGRCDQPVLQYRKGDRFGIQESG